VQSDVAPLGKLRGKVLVLGSDTRSFLAVIRSLGRAGLTVHTAWAHPQSLALRSRYISANHQLAEPTADFSEWGSGLVRLFQAENYSLVIPTNDQSIIPLQLNRIELSKSAPLYLVDDEVYEISRDKIRSCELANSLGLPLPKFAVVSSEAELEQVAVTFQFPLVVKPRSSFTEKDLHAKNHVWKARDLASFMARARGALPSGSLLVQEHFSGVGVGVEVLAQAGEVLYAFQHRRLHEPLHGGGSTYRCSEALNAELLEGTRQLVRALNYTGIGMFEFRVNQTSKQWIFVEINSRFWGSLPLAIAAGADFPRFLFEMLVLGRRNFPAEYSIPLFARNLVSDLRYVWSNLTASKSDELLNTTQNVVVLKELFNVVTLRERWDTLTLDDPSPGLAELIWYAKKILLRTKRFVRSCLLSLPPVRRHLQSRIKQRFLAAREVLFVCKGNICRSPFAEQLARSRYSVGFPPAVKFRSAALLSSEGRPSPETALQSAELFGVSLTAHRSVTVTPEMVANAELIFVFDEQNLTELSDQFPDARARIFFLGLLGQGHAIEIADPFGGGAEDFAAAYGKISNLINLLPPR